MGLTDFRPSRVGSCPSPFILPLVPFCIIVATAGVLHMMGGSLTAHFSRTTRTCLRAQLLFCLIVLPWTTLSSSAAALLSPSCTSSGLRIALFTLATPGAHYSTTYSIQRNAAYARHHGYDFYVETCPDTSHPHEWIANEQHRANWAKPYFLRKHLRDHHIVVYVDADAYFVDAERSIESFVTAHMAPRFALLLPQNCDNDGCWNDMPNCTALNTAFVVARRSALAMSVLDLWSKAWQKECREYAFIHPREQACISLLYRDSALVQRAVAMVTPAQELFIATNGTWIKHFFSKDKDKNALAATMRTDLLRQVAGVVFVKHATNPVLGGPALGTCFDISVVQGFFPDASYAMFLSWRLHHSVALALSNNGVTWSTPQIVLAPGTTWESVVNRPAVVVEQSGLKMWYTGQDVPESYGRSVISLATSVDGRVWKKHGSPVLEPSAAWEKASVMNPCVLHDEAAHEYRMYFSAGDNLEPFAIGMATSFDGVRWKRGTQPVFRAEGNGWERERVSGAHVLRHAGWWYMFYIGYETMTLARIGLARSKDGIDGWQRFPGNPLLSPDPGKWDCDAVYKPFVLKTDAGWLLWYNGRCGSQESSA